MLTERYDQKHDTVVGNSDKPGPKSSRRNPGEARIFWIGLALPVLDQVRDRDTMRAFGNLEKESGLGTRRESNREGGCCILGRNRIFYFSRPPSLVKKTQVPPFGSGALF